MLQNTAYYYAEVEAAYRARQLAEIMLGNTSIKEKLGSLKILSRL
jgi:hypothetical protein